MACGDLVWGAQPASLLRPELKVLVREASVALARLDAVRLEELAACCRQLTAVAKDEAREAAAEMAILDHMLQATRANVDVMSRLNHIRQRGAEYSAPATPQSSAGCGNGHD